MPEITSPASKNSALSPAPSPVMYSVRSQAIPAKLTIQQRITFAQGAGVPPAGARALGVQDRASSMLCVMQSLIERSGNAALIEAANRQIENWNRECAEVFER